jgi:hypothetical protein
MTFLQFWGALNVALAVRDEPEALFAEARAWFGWRPVVAVDARLINHVINDRRPA